MKTRSFVLMFGSKARVGKDTSCNFLTPIGYKQLSFAAKLKEVVSDLYDFNHDQMHGDSKDQIDLRYPNLFDKKEITAYESDEYGEMPWTEKLVANPIYKPTLSPRRILQIFGQQQRAIFPDIWAQYVFTQIDKLASKEHDNFFCISDFRFKNEFTVAKRWKSCNNDFDKFVIPIKVNRPDLKIDVGSSDISEKDLDDFNDWRYIVENDSTIEALGKKILEIDSTFRN